MRVDDEILGDYDNEGREGISEDDDDNDDEDDDNEASDKTGEDNIKTITQASQTAAMTPSTQRQYLLDYLAVQGLGGGGGHSLFMRTWGSGLAYSSGLSADENSGTVLMLSSVLLLMYLTLVKDKRGQDMGGELKMERDPASTVTLIHSFVPFIFTKSGCLCPFHPTIRLPTHPPTHPTAQTLPTQPPIHLSPTFHLPAPPTHPFT
jgi:hypothetical protein